MRNMKLSLKKMQRSTWLAQGKDKMWKVVTNNYQKKKRGQSALEMLITHSAS